MCYRTRELQQELCNECDFLFSFRFSFFFLLCDFIFLFLGRKTHECICIATLGKTEQHKRMKENNNI